MERGGIDPTDPRGKLVLIVDDDDNIRSLLEVVVSSGGFKVLVGDNGEKAIAMLAQKPDAILLDLIMPGCGGLGVLKHLKSISGPIPPVIVVTAYEPRHPSVVEAIMDPNVVQCLAKPVNHEVLVEALHRYLKTDPLPSKDDAAAAQTAESPAGGISLEIEDNFFFKGFSPDAKKLLAASAQRETFPDRMWLFSEGDSSDWVYLIVSGKVELIRTASEDRMVTLEVIEPGGYFGEVGILENSGRNAGARAKGTVTVLKIPCVEVRKALKNEPSDVTMHLMRRVLTYLRSANDRFMKALLQREKRQLIGEMAGSIVHDFKNPLTGIHLAATVIRQAHPKDQGTLKCCKIIEDQTMRMVGMAQEFLDFARGKPSLKRESHKLKDLFDRFNSLNADFLLESNVSLLVAPGETVVFADADRFLRILQNLVGNAADAMMPKGGKIHLEAVRVKDRVNITVKDDGPGIPEAIRQQVFEPFVTHGKKRGTGLGMAIVKSLVEAHEGRISFSTETGRGTTFNIDLPALATAKSKEIPN